MPDRQISFITTGTGFCPLPMDGTRWWAVGDWAKARDAHSGMWPGNQFWLEGDWRQLYAEGYRYCALLKDGHSVAVAGLWPRTESEWEVIAVGTAPAHRNRGYARGIVTFVTQEILSVGRFAGITTRHDNSPMLRVIERLGFIPKSMNRTEKVESARP